MKTLILLTLSLVSTNTSALAQSLDRKMEAVVRTEDNKAVIDEVVLKDLISSEGFDGEHFKIVRGKSDEAVSFTDEYDLTFRAATTYYHLTKARDYFVNVAKSGYVKNLPKIVVRIDHSNQFSELGHFAHDNLNPQFNNALTIPAGKGLSSRGIRPWEMEIWFRPAKTIHLRELKSSSRAAAQELQVMLSQFRDQTRMQSFQSFLSMTLRSLLDSEGGNGLTIENSIRAVGATVFLEAVYHSAHPITKIFARKNYWLDTALVPEIIYHEYAHVALSDHLELSHSTAVIEGMADFFAGEIASSHKLAMNIKKYNTFNGKNAKNKKKYMLEFETTNYANTDFVFGMLWHLKTILGEDKASEFVFNLRTKISTNSSVRGQLIEGILSTCEEVCREPFVDKLKILKNFSSRGL